MTSADKSSAKECSIEAKNLHFSYPGIDGRPLPGLPPVLDGVSFALPPGSRCLLIGPNGAGKTTMLKILAGKHMVDGDSIRVLGRSPFHDTKLTSDGDLAYVGGAWERDVAFAGYRVPLQGDFPASQIIKGIHGVDPKRAERLMEVMDVNPDWKMHLVSDGQRRRVQICVGLLKPFKVLLLDEVTVDLDVLGRADLMRFLTEECEQRGASIIYATHIFDGLEGWPTHMSFLAGGHLKVFEKVSAFPEVAEMRLLDLVIRWLREEKEVEEKQRSLKSSKDKEAPVEQPWNNGWAPGRLASSLAGSSNTVLRM
ncbi:hypothetical protein BSKO_06084 [Bryopsis sp. KO-2023]|nr:hypothetical protein BSKO_06084 [Bryopsis sp. KO-2023]